MRMIWHPANLVWSHLVPACYGAEIGPEPLLYIGCDPWMAQFGAEYDVIVERSVGVAH
jgi:hypothetical protein